MRDLLLSWFSLAGHSLGGRHRSADGLSVPRTRRPADPDWEWRTRFRSEPRLARGNRRRPRFAQPILSIHQRPFDPGDRSQAGHWEATSSSAKTRVRRSERSSNGRPGSYGCCIYGAVTPTACGRRLPRFSRSTAIADPVDHLGSGYRDGQTHRHHRRAGNTGLFLRLALTLAARQKRKRQRFVTPILPKRHQPEPVHARTPDDSSGRDQQAAPPCSGRPQSHRSIHRTASLPGPSTVATMTRTHLADSWSDSVAVDMRRYFDDAYACAWRVRCFMHRSASNQTSLAFHPGKVGSEVGGKSFFAVTVYATAT